MTERKIALITGGSRGIGLSCALELARSGCDIIINDICDAQTAQPAIDEIKATGANAYFYSFDVSNDAQVQENVEQMIKDHGKIDILLNNAGITKDGLFVRMDAEQWERVIRINLSSAYYVTHAVIKHMMKARQGSIISMSSVVGVHGNPGQAKNLPWGPYLMTMLRPHFSHIISVTSSSIFTLESSVSAFLMEASKLG